MAFSRSLHSDVVNRSSLETHLAFTDLLLCCLSPSLLRNSLTTHPSKRYQKRLQETSSLQQTKRSKKNSKASSKTADEDPFAEPSAASSGLASGIDPLIKNGGGGLFGAEIAKRENEKKGDEGGI